jgi:hypothetical protein
MEIEIRTVGWRREICVRAKRELSEGVVRMRMENEEWRMYRRMRRRRK